MPEARDVCHRVRLLEFRQIGDDTGASRRSARACCREAGAPSEMPRPIRRADRDSSAALAIATTIMSPGERCSVQPLHSVSIAARSQDGRDASGAHHSASRLSSARSASAWSGVKLSTSTARSRARSAIVLGSRRLEQTKLLPPLAAAAQ